MHNLCFGIIGATAIFSGSILFAGHFTMTPTLTELNIFDPNKQPNYPGILSIVEASMAAATILIGLVSAQAVLCDDNRKNSKYPLRISGFIYLLFGIVSCVFFLIRAMNTGLFDMDGVCSNVGVNGCPPIRYESVLPFEIEDKGDCLLNVWTENPDLFQSAQLTEANGSPIDKALDWSKDDTYDTLDFNPNSNKLFNNSFVPPDLYECVYWGCHHICNDRHRMNQVWLYSSIAATVIYILLGVLSLVTPFKETRKYRKLEEV